MKYSKILIINLIASYILSTIITIIMNLGGFFGAHLFDMLTKGMLSGEVEALLFFLIVGFIIFLALNLMFLPFYVIKLLLLAKDSINKKYVDTKEPIYTRDLPEYNAAVAGEIVDFKTTFEEEYIAGVMELISKGFIIENEDELIVDKSKSTEKLLRNEKYILETCTNINSNLYLLKNYEFYKELKEDMYDLGLYKRNNFLKEIKNKIAYYIEKNKKRTFLIYIFIMILPVLASILMQNFLVMILLYLIILILIRKNKLTKKGELEKEKMGKLKLFLEKETDFKNKGEAERKLWGRYSAFAVAFGVNKEMKEKIKNKIIKKV